MEVFIVGIFEIIGSILLILSCLVLIVVISLQSSAKSQGGLSALGAVQENTASGRQKAKTIDAMLVKATKILAIVMFALTFAVYAMDKLLG